MLLLVILAVFAILPVFAGSPPPIPAGWTDGYVWTNGIRMHYYRTGGNKPVLIMAHGAGDDGMCWTNLAKELTNDFDMILIDARGHGLSDPRTPTDAPDAQVEDLVGLIRELKLVKPILMGHSMGSASVAWLAAKYPDIPRAIVLEDPGLGAGGPGAAAAGRGPAGAGSPEERRARILTQNNTSFDDTVAQCMKNSPKWGQSECEYWAPSKRRQHPGFGFAAGAGAAAGRPPISEIFAKITVPTLILKADAQGEARQKNEEAAAILKKGKIVHIEGAGHNVRRENKARVLDVLKPWLAGV